MLKSSSIRFLGLGPFHMCSQNQIYRIKSTNVSIVPMNAKPEQSSIWINEVKKISIPEISKSNKPTKINFQK